LKKVLIISPYFPPVNAADMQRIRTSLPYFAANGWEPSVVMIDEAYADVSKDELLTASLPAGIPIYKVKALKKSLTAKLGLGSIALRALWHYRQKVDELLSGERFDLIYFSTTQFPVCALGARWKRKFRVPYVIDMQDPWYSEHYLEKPKSERPPKYRFIYALHKYLERVAMEQVDGLISVSQSYIDTLRNRYTALKDVPSSIITFGAYSPDIAVTHANRQRFTSLLTPDTVNIVYAGRGGNDMHKAIIPVFEALKIGLSEQPELFSKLRFYFIGTSYAPKGEGKPTILPLARQLGVEDFVTELTDRISYYHTLFILEQADALFIPGSDHSSYTASKIYPYLVVQKPLLAIFNKESSAAAILQTCALHAEVLTFDENQSQLTKAAYSVLKNWAAGKLSPVVLLDGFNHYSSAQLTSKQTDLFDSAITHFETTHTNA
jgi:hypothetical protein